jgi:hypothetical protein
MRGHDLGAGQRVAESPTMSGRRSADPGGARARGPVPPVSGIPADSDPNIRHPPTLTHAVGRWQRYFFIMMAMFRPIDRSTSSVYVPFTAVRYLQGP